MAVEVRLCELLKVTLPAPLITLHVLVSVPGGFVSVTTPLSFTLLVGSVICWATPALTNGPLVVLPVRVEVQPVQVADEPVGVALVSKAIRTMCWPAVSAMSLTVTVCQVVHEPVFGTLTAPRDILAIHLYVKCIRQPLCWPGACPGCNCRWSVRSLCTSAIRRHVT